MYLNMRDAMFFTKNTNKKNSDLKLQDFWVCVPVTATIYVQ